MWMHATSRPTSTCPPWQGCYGMEKLSSIPRVIMSTFVPASPQLRTSTFGQSLEASIDEELLSLKNSLDACQSDKELLDRVVTSSAGIISAVLLSIRSGNICDATERLTGCMKALETKQDARLTCSRLSTTIENLTQAQLMLHFLSTGRLAPRCELSPCNDEEYIGAILSVAHDISKYSQIMACDGEYHSVLFCKSFLSVLNCKMLEFYFRNGPLRRKYDGLKYALKRVENIVFEISMTPSPEGGWTYPSLSSTEGLSPQDVEPVTKKSRTDCSILKVDFFDQHHFLSASDLDGVRERLEAMDAQREVVIKKSRDTQKLSKQAIFSMQGDRLDEALQKLNKARDVVVELLPVVAQHPSLRVGSFSNSLEEWAEGRMFLAWLADARVIGMSELGSDMLGIDLTAHEYVGALSDFTGEMGRLAVKRASARHLEGVLEVREVIAAIVRAMSVLSLGEKFAQKFMAMTTNLQKVEDLIYELCMMQKSGSSRPKLRSDETATEEGK